jgi:hypothetical protein
MLIVLVNKSCNSTGIERGDIYYATEYDDDKFILECRVKDGFDPCCTEYKINVTVVGKRINVV